MLPLYPHMRLIGGPSAVATRLQGRELFFKAALEMPRAHRRREAEAPDPLSNDVLIWRIHCESVYQVLVINCSGTHVLRTYVPTSCVPTLA